MKYVIVETSDDCFTGDDEFAAFQSFLMGNPHAGTVIRGAGGLRKIRWSGRGHGKRGGIRVVYLHVPRHCLLYLLDVYSKDEQDDLSADDRRVMAALAERIRAALDERAR